MKSCRPTIVDLTPQQLSNLGIPASTLLDEGLKAAHLTTGALRELHLTQEVQEALVGLQSAIGLFEAAAIALESERRQRAKAELSSLQQQLQTDTIELVESGRTTAKKLALQARMSPSSLSKFMTGMYKLKPDGEERLKEAVAFFCPDDKKLT